MANPVLAILGPALLLFFISSQVSYAVLQGNSTKGPSSTSGKDTSVVNLASVGFKPNGTKLQHSLGALSPGLLMGDQLGGDEPKCLPDAQREADKCVDETNKKLHQTTDQEKRCDLLYNGLLCQIAAYCKCTNIETHKSESGWKKNLESANPKCDTYFNDYKYMSQDYCNLTQCGKAFEEADHRCAKEFKKPKGLEKQCHKAFGVVLCIVDGICSKCDYDEAHSIEVAHKTFYKSKLPQCAIYYKDYKFMSQDRCTPTGLDNSTESSSLSASTKDIQTTSQSSTTKRSSIWIIIGGVVGGVGGLVLCCICVCCCIFLFNKKDDKQSTGGKILGTANEYPKMSSFPSSNVGSTPQLAGSMAPSQLASAPKVSGIPSSKVDSAAKMSTMLSSKVATKSRLGAGKAKGKTAKSKIAKSQSKPSNVGPSKSAVKSRV